MNEIEKLLINDNVYKKRIGNNVKRRASRRGYIKGGIRTQSDYLTKKEKLELNGDVKVSNVYEDIKNIPTYNEFREKDYALRKSILENAKKFHKTKDIAKQMGISASTLYNILSDYNITSGTGNGRYKVTKKELGNYLLPDEERSLLLRGVLDIAKKLCLDTLQKGKIYVNLRVNGVKTQDIANIMKCTNSTVSLYSNDYFRAHDKGIQVDVNVRDIFTKVVKLYNIKYQVRLYKDQPIELNGGNERVVIYDNLDDINIEPAPKFKDTKENIDEIIADELKQEIERLKVQLEAKERQIQSYERKTGTYVSLSGEYTSDELEDRIIAATSIIQNQKTYKINLTLEEV